MNQLETFHQYRPLLFAIAYRMLSSKTDAEDMIQEAWIRWQSTQAVVRSPKAFLSTLITRLCIDQLRSARVKREHYIGTWLPEPLVTSSPPESDAAELSESISFAFLTLLDCLSPIERAVFLLHEVFDFKYAEISAIIGKSIPNCRQIAHRARQQFPLEKTPEQLSRPDQTDIINQFMASWYQRDIHRLVALMAEDVTFWSDGGGQATAVQKPLHGNQKVARFLVALRRSRLVPQFHSQLVQINQQPGLLNTINQHTQSTFSFDFSGQGIQAIFAVVNPQKLKGISC